MMKKLRRAKRLQKQAAQKSQIPAQAIGRRRRPWLPLRTLLVAQLLFAAPVFAAPQGGQVTSGSATINQEGTVTNIDQNSGKAIINWQSFGIAPNETVNFNQPNSHAVALNRVVGHESSLIEGALNANGQVFLINSAGVTIANGASINTAGFVASTQDISDADFLNGDYTFSGDSDAAVINLGTITATDGGYVILLGKTVSNQGVITATKGTVALAGGAQTTLNFNGDSIVSVTVDQGTLDALVENKEAIYADGGNVILTAKAADDLLSAQVNNSGIIQARTIDDLTGYIKLYAHGGTTTVDGTLDASAPNSGDGGFIETSGDTVTVADSALITTLASDGDTGTWLIDPDGFVIGNNGDMTGAALSTALETNNMIIDSINGSGDNGDIDVNDAVSWSANTLTLNATHNINVNAAITASGTNAGLSLIAGTDINFNADVTLSGESGSLAMAYGGDYNLANDVRITLSGTVASLTINGNAYTLIQSMDDLLAMDDNDGDASDYYAITEDLDASGTLYSNALVNTLSGTLAGLGHSISNLTILASDSSYIGLIGTASGGSVVRDLNSVAFDVTGLKYVGGLIGYAGSSSSGVTVSNCTVSGTVKSEDGSKSERIGGLIGYLRNGSVSDSSSEATVTGYQYVGGLIGYATGTSSSAVSISNSSSSGTVNGTYYSTRKGVIKGSQYVGGLFGYIQYATISDSSSDATVTAYTNLDDDGFVISTGTSTYTGGLGGYAKFIDISDSSASGDVIGYMSVGGLFGMLWGSDEYPSTVTNSNASGYVTSVGGTESTHGSDIGGLFGKAGHSTISASYATGDVTGFAENIGGLIGSSQVNTISNSHATGAVTNTAVAGDVEIKHTGGLIGFSQKDVSITDSYATGDVAGQLYVGGLIGEQEGTSDTYTVISGCYATGDVSTNDDATYSSYAGGLIGGAQYIEISNSYATGNLNLTNTSPSVGGLFGGVQYGTITDSYATGNVIGAANVGGLIGTGGYLTLDNVSASGNVIGDASAIGGLAGYIYSSTVTNASATGNVYAVSDRYDGSGKLIDIESVGGLVGASNLTSYSNISASGNVTVRSNDNGSYGALIGNTAGDTIDGATATGSFTVNDEDASNLNGEPTDLFKSKYGDSTVTNSTYTDVAAVAQQERENSALNIATDIASSEQQGEYSVQKISDWAEETTSGRAIASVDPVADNITYSNSSNYSSSIKSIEIDGVRYEMEENSGNRKKK